MSQLSEPFETHLRNDACTACEGTQLFVCACQEAQVLLSSMNIVNALAVWCLPSQSRGFPPQVQTTTERVDPLDRAFGCANLDYLRRPSFPIQFIREGQLHKSPKYSRLLRITSMSISVYPTSIHTEESVCSQTENRTTDDTSTRLRL